MGRAAAATATPRGPSPGEAEACLSQSHLQFIPEGTGKAQASTASFGLVCTAICHCQCLWEPKWASAGPRKGTGIVSACSPGGRELPSQCGGDGTGQLVPRRPFHSISNVRAVSSRYLAVTSRDLPCWLCQGFCTCCSAQFPGPMGTRRLLSRVARDLCCRAVSFRFLSFCVCLFYVIVGRQAFHCT